MNIVRAEASRVFTHLGSLATDPICSAHKNFVYLTLGENRIYPKCSSIILAAKKTVALVKFIFLFPIGILTGAVGIIFRFTANLISPNPFIYKKGSAKELPAKSNPSIFKWNICGIGGGFPTYQNGLKPWDERLDKIIDKVKSQKTDLVFLEEVYDYKLALKLFEALKGDYTNFYFNIGAKAIGAPSGLFVASKVPISDPQFKAFPSSTNVGRIKFVGKGLFSFDSGEYSFHHTHFQHSEDIHNQERDDYKKEINGRKEQVKITLEKILDPKKNKQRHILLGDLNMPPAELKSSPLMKYFQSPPNLGNCSYFPIEKSSKELKEERAIKNEGSFIDYVLLMREKGTILTELVEAFSLKPSEVKESLSDHHGLTCRLTATKNIFQSIFA